MFLTRLFFRARRPSKGANNTRPRSVKAVLRAEELGRRDLPSSTVPDLLPPPDEGMGSTALTLDQGGDSGPAGSPVVMSHTPSGPVSQGPVSAMTFVFSDAMDQGSFRLEAGSGSLGDPDEASDLISFTGPGGDLRASVTGFSWLSATELRVLFAAVTQVGTYEMVIGPYIRRYGDGSYLDTDRDGLAGEATDDRYAATFTLLSGGGLGGGGDGLGQQGGSGGVVAGMSLQDQFFSSLG